MRRFALSLPLSLLFALCAAAQTEQPVLCKYKTFTDINLYSDADPNATRVGKAPRGKTFQALAKKSYWVLIEHKGVSGWAATTAMVRDESSCPKIHHLEFKSLGYKIIGGVHRNFFSIYNSGTADYTGKITVGVFSGERMLNEVEADFSARPLTESGGRSFYIDTYSQAERFVFESADGKQSGPIGRLIERIP
jgi:uncharacterized protein YraI